MGAILGRIEFGRRPIDTEAFRKAANAIRPYGIQHGSLSIDPYCAFALCDTAVTRGRPIESKPISKYGLTVVGDAIIDNRHDLAAALGLGQRDILESSDAALIHAAWRRFGPTCVERLVGDFAFTIWDESAQRCWLVRDHIGARPLYWSLRKDSLIFATDIRAITSFEDMEWDVDEHMVAHFLANPYRRMPKTFFKNIESVPPGGITAIDPVGARTKLWWAPKAMSSPGGHRPSEVLEAFCDLTKEAIRCRINTDLPVGSHISGGIDSTIVTGLSAEVLGSEGRRLAGGYTWSPGESDDFPPIGPGDERQVIKTCGERYKFTVRYSDHHESETRLRALFRPMAFEGTAGVAEEIDVLTKAKADGVRVLLSGWGGDEAFSSHGYGYLAWMLRHGRMWDAARAVDIRRKRFGLGTAAGYVWRDGVVPMLPDSLFRKVSPLYEYFPDQCFADRELIRHASDAGILNEKPLRIHSQPTILDQEMLAQGHIATRMETWATWSSEKNVVHRYPLTDRRLLEFILSLAPNERFDRGYGRTLPVMGYRTMLPERIAKTDAVNEEKRQTMRIRCLKQLVQHEETMQRAEASIWLDQERFRNAIHRASRMTLAELRTERRLFANLFGATRILYLAG